MAITIDAAAGALNQYQVRYKPGIQQALKKNNDLEMALSPVYCEYSYAAPNASVGALVQPYQVGFTPNLTANFSAEENILQVVKVDIQFTADDLDKWFDKWMAETDQRGISRLEYTFPQFLYDNHIIPQVTEDLAGISFAGEYAAPTPGTPGAVTTSADGLHKKIKDAITASKITPIATGALVSTTIVDQVEAFADGLPEPYKSAPGQIWMSSSWATAYWRDYRANFGSAVGTPGNANNDLRVDGTNKVIRGFHEMAGSDRLIFVPNQTRTNMIIGHKRGRPTMPVIRWQEFERTLKGLAEFHRFYGFEYAGHVFVNDQV